MTEVPAMGNASVSRKRDSVAVLRDVVFIVALYIYFCGWVYVYVVYTHFGVSLNALDIPFYYFFVYSYSALVGAFSYSWTVIIIALVSVAVFMLLVYLLLPDHLRRLVWALCLIILFPGFFFLARREANKEIADIRTGYTKRIMLVLKKNVTEHFPKEFIEANKKGQLILLAQTKDRVFVLRQSLPSGDTDQIPYGFVYDVSRADILDRKSTRLNSSHSRASRMPSSA